MNWITRQNVGIDRIACAWLIRKRIDPQASFLFIGHDEEISEDAGLPFDIPGCKLSHHRGRCTFNTLLREYGIKDAALDVMAKIIDGADCVNEIVPSPESYGLEAICIGLRKYLGEDQLAIRQGELVFESLYAYIKDRNTERSIS